MTIFNVSLDIVNIHKSKKPVLLWWFINYFFLRESHWGWIGSGTKNMQPTSFNYYSWSINPGPLWLDLKFITIQTKILRVLLYYEILDTVSVTLTENLYFSWFKFDGWFDNFLIFRMLQITIITTLFEQ